MYLSTEDARSDVILAAAAAVFGGLLISFLLAAPGIPTAGIAAELIVLASWFALSGLTPYLLARYRQDVPGAFGLGGGGTFSPEAWLFALPAAVVGLARGFLVDGSPTVALLGRAGRPLVGSPTVGVAAVDVAGTVLAVLQVVVLTAGSVLLVGFLAVRGRDAFRSDERSATELLRTFGLGAVAAALVLGAVGSIGSGRIVVVLLNVTILGVVVLAVDRTVPARATITRPAVLTPVAVVVVAHVLAAGGLFRGDLLFGLYTGALAAGTAVVIAVLVEHHRSAALALPLLVAVHWWPTCVGPLPFGLAGVC